MLRLPCWPMLLPALLLLSCSQNNTLFRELPASETGIEFQNTITETDSINVLDFENVYNGGGVGIADFNNDGLQDIYFTGNLVPNKLYLNKGELRFEDVSAKAGVAGGGRWSRGVSVVDINNDGWMDIYVAATGKVSPGRRTNLLYINQGAAKGAAPVFREMAGEYGLADTTQSTMSAFFDYDNDGDLDVYVAVNHIMEGDYPNRFRPRMVNGEHPSTGRLYRNDYNAALKHPVFTDVSRQAGVLVEGYTHNVSISDFDLDGWKDIYVTNDYISANVLYLNNRDGTFTDSIGHFFKHTAANAMGSDVADLNNDGLQDLIELDMNPEDNYRKKMMLNGNSYQTYQNSDQFGIQYQYVRNTIQLNNGPRVLADDSIGAPIFSDISFFTGMAETDWSWTPVVADFDRDGYRDVIITNGFPKDVTDHDFIAFRNEAFALAAKADLLAEIPEVKLHNYAYRNRGDLTFSDESENWGLQTPTFSNGAAYADLDNDGDLDMVINNINDKASVYENTLADGDEAGTRYLRVRLKGEGQNRNALGAVINLYYGGRQQVHEVNPYRGYLSSVQLDAHFGLDTITRIDSVVVRWPGGKKSVLTNVPANQVLSVDIAQANSTYNWNRPMQLPDPLFTDITEQLGLRYVHNQRDQIDFNIQKLLPHKFSEYGPALAAGDLNGDGLDDVVVGAAAGASASVLLQQQNGSFATAPLAPPDANKRSDDMGVALLDADGDGDLDVYVAAGGFADQAGAPSYADRFFLNDGKGRFTQDSIAIPQGGGSNSCVRPADFDRDGDLDLLVAGRVVPWKYPQPAASRLLRNDSKNGTVRFTDVTAAVAPVLATAGMVCDAIWTDYDHNGWPDLALAGEWMPVTFLKNEGGKFAASKTEIAGSQGWWTSIVPGDFDNDGDVDYVLGNLGLNSFYQGSKEEPVRLYAKDFDNNGNFDAIPTLYLPASQGDKTRGEYPAHVRDDMTKQLIVFRSKFQNYRSYATATFDKMLTPAEREGATVLTATHFANSFLRNDGQAQFSLVPLPAAAQYACLNGMLAEDFDADGNLDLLVTGNDYGTEVSIGRYDACNGLFLKGNGKGGFKPLQIAQSGWFVPGNAKALVKLRDAGGRTLLAASQNRGQLKIFAARKAGAAIGLAPGEVYADVQLANGQKRRVELPFGASFLSQSARFMNLPAGARNTTIVDQKGAKRTVQP